MATVVVISRLFQLQRPDTEQQVFELDRGVEGVPRCILAEVVNLEDEDDEADEYEAEEKQDECCGDGVDAHLGSPAQSR